MSSGGSTLLSGVLLHSWVTFPHPRVTFSSILECHPASLDRDRNWSGVSPSLGDGPGDVYRPRPNTPFLYAATPPWVHQNNVMGPTALGVYPMTGPELRLLRGYVFSQRYKSQVRLVSQTSALALFSSFIAFTLRSTTT